MEIYTPNLPIDNNLPERYRHSMFLVGPSPRDSQTPTWRPDAIKILERIGYDGVVLSPEDPLDSPRRNPDGSMNSLWDYNQQVEWELWGLEVAQYIVAWVPRHMRDMPGLTTNVEFGRYVSSGKLWYGRPPDAEHCRYLDYIYRKLNKENPFEDLEILLKHVADLRLP
jgi:hypothetical protein